MHQKMRQLSFRSNVVVCLFFLFALLLVVGWLLVVGCWLLVVGCWLLVVGCCEMVSAVEMSRF
jgi:hypothetical protein